MKKFLGAILLTIFLPTIIFVLAIIQANNNEWKLTSINFSDKSYLIYYLFIFAIFFILSYGLILIYSLLFKQLRLSSTKTAKGRRLILLSIITIISFGIIFIIYFFYTFAYAFFSLSLPSPSYPVLQQ